MKGIQSIIVVLIIIFVLIFLLSKRTNKFHEKIALYLTGKRNQLLQQHFPECTYYYEGNLTSQQNFSDMIVNDYRTYALHVNRNYASSIVYLTHKISKKPGRSGDMDSDDTYNDYYILEPVPTHNKCFTLPGVFYTESILDHGVALPKLFNMIQHYTDPSGASQTNTYGNIKFTMLGKIYYNRIPQQDWDRFVSTRVLELLEQICTLWKGSGTVGFRYENNRLIVQIREVRVPYETFAGPMVLLQESKDFLVQKADLFNKTMDLLNEIAEEMI